MIEGDDVWELFIANGIGFLLYLINMWLYSHTAEGQEDKLLEPGGMGHFTPGENGQYPPGSYRDSSDIRIPDARESKMIDRVKKLWSYYSSKR